MAVKSTNLLLTTNLLLANYGDSKKLSVKNNQQDLEFINNDTQNFFLNGLSYLDFILDPLANYVMEVKLEQSKGQSKYFRFGLISDSNKDALTLNIGDYLCYSEYNGGSDINTQLKGQSIRTKDDSLEKRSLEIRVNIQRRILKVGSLPNYDSVVQADNPQWINPSTPYRFFLGGLNKQTKITITKLQTVSQFDNLM